LPTANAFTCHAGVGASLNKSTSIVFFSPTASATPFVDPTEPRNEMFTFSLRIGTLLKYGVPSEGTQGSWPAAADAFDHVRWSVKSKPGSIFENAPGTCAHQSPTSPPPRVVYQGMWSSSGNA
jgi:hypothetical protein